MEDAMSDRHLRRNDRVRHSKYGDGTIVGIDWNISSVQFDRGGRKLVLTRELQRCTQLSQA